MYCPKCGKQKVDDARFCAGCGAVLNEVQAQAAPAQPVQPQPMTQAAPAQPVVQAVPMQQPQPMAQPAPVKKKKTGFKVFLAILVVLLLVGGGVVSFMFISKASHDRKVKDQLALAEQYLDELQYEEAIAAYMAVLDLEPASEDAADGLTDTYIKWAESCAADGDYDKALEILQNVDDRASSKKIKKEVSEIEAQQEAYQEQLRIEQEQREEEERQRLAEEAREKAGETLQNYLEDTLIPTYGLLDCNAIYMADYEKYEYLIGMDDWNISNMIRIAGGDPAHKIYKLLMFADDTGDIADPWYTGEFGRTYEDIVRGCEGLLKHLVEK